MTTVDPLWLHKNNLSHTVDGHRAMVARGPHHLINK